MGCNVAASDNAPARTFNFGMRPVDIAASARRRARQDQRPVRRFVVLRRAGSFTDSTATTKKLSPPGGFKHGDLAIVAVNPAPRRRSAECQLIEITGNTNPDGYTVAHDVTAYTSYYAASGAAAVAPRFNSASAPAFSSGRCSTLARGRRATPGPSRRRRTTAP